MGLNAVQAQVASYLNGLPVVGYNAAVSARVLAPVDEYMKVSNPTVFVWGGAATFKRTAIPRGPGWMGVEYIVSCWIYGLELANDPNREWKFPAAVDAIAKALYGASPMPAQITDPQTGAVSHLMDLGEHIKWEYDIDRTVSVQNLVRNVCHMEVTALEEFNA
jgi:hypothetical protein